MQILNKQPIPINEQPEKKYMVASDIYQNRLEFAKKLIGHNKFNLDIYATYFEISRKTAQSDIEKLGYKIKDIESEDPLSYQKLVLYRDKLLEENQYNLETLTKLGFWYRPSSNKDPIYHYYADDKNIRLQSAIEYYKTERTGKTHPYSYIADKFAVSTKELKAIIAEQKIKNNEHNTVAEHHQELKTLLRYSRTADIFALTGVTRQTLCETARELSQRYIKEHKDLIGEHTPTKLSYRNEKRRQKVWELYNAFGSSHGRTQQEIADELGLSRQTVISDLKMYKKEHPEVIDQTQLYQPHHLGYEKTLARNEKAARAVALYKEGNTITQISKELGTNINTVNVYLIEQGIKDPYGAEKYNELNEQLSVTQKAIKGYEEKGQFTVRLVNNENKLTSFHGATSHLLDEAGAPAYTTNTEERNKIRRPILEAQRRTMAAIRNDSNAQAEFFDKHGNILDYLSVHKEKTKTLKRAAGRENVPEIEM